MHQVFDFSAMPDTKKDPVCTYTVFYSDERSADESRPILVLDNSFLYNSNHRG